MNKHQVSKRLSQIMTWDSLPSILTNQYMTNPNLNTTTHSTTSNAPVRNRLSDQPVEYMTALNKLLSPKMKKATEDNLLKKRQRAPTKAKNGNNEKRMKNSAEDNLSSAPASCEVLEATNNIPVNNSNKETIGNTTYNQCCTSLSTNLLIPPTLPNDPHHYMMDVFDKLLAPSIMTSYSPTDSIRTYLLREVYSDFASQALLNMLIPINSVEDLVPIILTIAPKCGLYLV